MVRPTADSLDSPGTRVPLRRQRPPAHPAAALAGPAAAAAGGSLLMLAFMLSLAVPGTFGVGPVNLTLYRVVLLGACIPLGLRWISGRAGPVTAVDLLFLASCIWISIALIAVHGLSRLVFIGTNFVELFGGYLMGRVMVRDAAGYRHFIQCLMLLLLGLFPFLLAEFLTGARLLNTLFGAVFSTPEVLPHTRLGFTRAVGPFPHPIHMGLIASVGFANIYFVLWRRREIVRLVAAGFVFATTMLAISSGPLFSLVLQTGMMLWERILAFLRSRWILAIVIGGVGFAVLLASVQGGLFTYVVENLVFSTGAGEHRLDIYRYGTRAVLQNPWFGVGLGEWARPFWREHPTIDSFWLMTAVRHGIPGILLLMIGLLVGMVRIATARGLDEDAAHYRSGYLIALCGLLLILSTVHIWGTVNVFVMAYFGAGAWFYARAAAPEPPPLRRRAVVRAPAPERRRPRGAGPGR